ncbi:MAG: amidohydrolase family protein [Pseudomonadales bacterium]|jgi:imidazolonepropionase-like amidohydrolase|tara:strand:+ start:38 stop:1282 length:1245 start_codon:yes stop_codon:yes gene_type:complete
MNSTLYTHATVFPATDESVISDGAVWVCDGLIRYAGPMQAMPEIPQGSLLVDANGKFLMPGMTETHAHLSFADASPFAIGDTSVEDATITAVGNAAKMLTAGFTSAVSFGSTYKIDVALRGAIESGRIIGPRLLAAGRDLGATASNVDSKGGLSQIADGPWALRQAVREQRRDGVDIVKIFIDGEAINATNPPGELSFCDEEVEAVVSEAHRRKMRVACHARSAAAVKQAVRAGVDFIGHANYLDQEAVDLLAAAKDQIFVGPAIAWEVQYLAQCESLGVSKATVRAQGYEREIEATIATVEKLRAAGVRLVVGGDYGISIAPHGTYAKDLEYFVALFGMRPADALLCATRNGGQAFDPKGRLGTLTEGAVADLVLVDGDPLSDITVLQDQSKLTVVKSPVSMVTNFGNTGLAY